MRAIMMVISMVTGGFRAWWVLRSTRAAMDALARDLRTRGLAGGGE